MYITLITSVAAVFCEMLLSYWIRPLLYSRRVLPIVRTVLTMICTLALIACKSSIDRSIDSSIRPNDLSVLIFQTLLIAQNNISTKVWTPTERVRGRSMYRALFNALFRPFSGLDLPFGNARLAMDFDQFHSHLRCISDTGFLSHQDRLTENLPFERCRR